MNTIGDILAARDRRVAQATCTETVRVLLEYLKRNGLLRASPAAVATVKRVSRNDAGQITAVVETLEQVERIS